MGRDCAKNLFRNRRSQMMIIVGAVLVCLSQFGCINSLVMIGKTLMGDPVRVSGFELTTGVSLKKEKKRVLIHCSAPFFLDDDYGGLTANIEEELIRRMKRNGLEVVNADVGAKVLDDQGGRFDHNLLARKVQDVDYIMHIQLERFTHRVEASPSLFRGQANGKITAYEVRGDSESRHAIQVFDQTFTNTYPSTYPVSADQMPKNVFLQRFIGSLSDSLGTTFYNVSASSLFAN